MGLGTAHGEVGFWNFERDLSTLSIKQSGQNGISALAFKADGTLLSGSADRSIKIWSPGAELGVARGSFEGKDWRPLQPDQATAWSGLNFDHESLQPAFSDPPKTLGQQPSSLRDEYDLAGFWKSAWSLLISINKAGIPEEGLLQSNCVKEWMKLHTDAPASILEGANRIQEIVRNDFASRHKDAALAALVRGDNEKALMELERANALMPDTNALMAYLGFAYQRSGQLDRANQLREKLGSPDINLVGSLARGLVQNPSDLNNLELSDSFAVWLSPEEPAFQVARGFVRLRAHRFDDTIIDLRSALEFYKAKPPAGGATLLWARLVLARAYRAKSDPTGAETELQICSKIVPTGGERPSTLLRYRAVAKALLGDYAGGEADCSEAMHADASEYLSDLYFDRLYLACVEALEAQSKPGHSEARAKCVSMAVDKLKSASTVHVEPVGYLRQFDDLKIVETLSENVEFAKLYHSPHS